MAGAGLENLPLVALENLLPRLDRESLIAASKVCVSWKRIVHDFTSRHVTNDVDSDLRDKLVKCGWILSEHDVERCRCIELYTSLFKFIGNVPMSCRELHRFSDSDLYDLYDSDLYALALSQSKLFFTAYDDGGDKEVVKVLDFMKETRMEQIEYPSKRNDCLNGIVHDKTLAVLMLAEQEPDDDMHIVCIWNHETLQLIHCLNENSFKTAMGLTQEELHTHKIDVSEIALAEDKLAVFLEIWVERKLISCQAQIWMLDTAEPSTANIRIWKTIEYDDAFGRYRYPISIDVHAMVMNSKLLCLAIMQRMENKLVLDFLLFDDLSRHTDLVYETDDFDLVIDDEGSKRVSVLDKQRFILKVYKFDGANGSTCVRIVNLSKYAKDSGVLRLNRFMMGKAVLIHCSDGKFKCILVNEDGDVIEGTNQLLKYPHREFFVNTNEIVALTSDKTSSLFKVYFYN